MSEFDPYIAEGVAKYMEGAILSNWVLIAEVFTEEGERTLIRLQNEEISDWTRLGLLHFALQAERPQEEEGDW